MRAVDGEREKGGGGGGRLCLWNMVVTASGLRYIYMAANEYLNSRIKRQAEAFRRGLVSLIAPEWLAMFSEPELQASRVMPGVGGAFSHAPCLHGVARNVVQLQTLISGSAGINVEDLRAHTRFVWLPLPTFRRSGEMTSKCACSLMQIPKQIRSMRPTQHTRNAFLEGRVQHDPGRAVAAPQVRHFMQ